jgi:hypothetical protein
MGDVQRSFERATGIGGAERGREFKLPRRDWILLPLIGLTTMAILLGSTELIARRMFPELKSTLGNCLIENDPATGVRGVPNSVCSEEGFEIGLVEYRFNGCGHRAGMECGPKATGTYRIAMVGTSTAFGTHLSREKTLAALLPAELSRQAGQKVELYNEALTWETPHSLALRFNEVLAAGPDMILWILTPWDILNGSVVLPATAPPDAGFLPTARRRLKASRTGVMLRYLVYKDPSSTVRLALLGTGGPEFLKAKPSTEWQRRLHEFDGYAAEIQDRARQAGIPLVVVFMPERAQAAMISMGQWPAGFDPYKLDGDLRSMIVGHGGTYIEILPEFRSIPDPETYYFQVDGHPNARGHAWLSALLARRLISGAFYALRIDLQPKAAQEPGR